jgi:hypothetical protein
MPCTGRCAGGSAGSHLQSTYVTLEASCRLDRSEEMTSNRVAFVAEYEDGRTVEFSIDRWTLTLGEYAAMNIAPERQQKGDLPRARSE